MVSPVQGAANGGQFAVAPNQQLAADHAASIAARGRRAGGIARLRSRGRGTGGGAATRGGVPDYAIGARRCP
ncbi:hypothetical protein L841_0231 [Mycobacterium sp. MAC_080597_8934]|nr:hypothetical protein L840_4681 [Mycobacterium sp. MAC_011194_8550]ETZ75269.1 hypothetical protein L841_0231 [Mycobacterium sp. MAC_080597_8934]